MRLKTSTWVAAVALAAASGLAAAQTVKIGIMTTYSGPTAGQGDQLDKGYKLYLKLHAKDLPPGVKVEPIFRDDTGANPDAAKRLAQELITRDQVQFLTGFVWTPNAAAIAPLTAEAKVPYVSANAAGVSIPRMSPYVARVSFTLWQRSEERRVGKEC
jgi:branched-chain amino acid transport system substrate-binding protein